MTEYFVNFDAQTTLFGNIDASQTTLQIVAVTASPTTPQFRIRIDNELMLVTGVAGTTYTVTRAIEGTTGATHDAGAIVRYVLSAGALGGQSDPAAAIPGLRSLGTSAQQAAAGNDPRFGAASTPTAHASTHHSGGSDPLAGQSIAGLLTTSTPTFAAIGIGVAPVSGSIRIGTGDGQLRLESGAASYIYTSTGSLNLGTYGTSKWQLESNFYPLVDNAYDLGSSSYRVRNLVVGTSVALSSGANLNWNGDTFLVREAANTLAMRNGTTPQALKVYGGTNNIHLLLYGNWADQGPMISVGRTAPASPFLFLSAGDGLGGTGFIFSNDSHIAPWINNVFDLGHAGARHWRSGYFNTSVQLSSAANLNWNGDTFLIREGPSSVVMRNGATNQYFGTYEAYSDGSNYSKLSMTGSLSGGPALFVQAAGIYAGSRNLLLSAATAYGGSGYVIIYDSALQPNASNSKDLGASNAHWRTGYFGTSVALSASANLNWNGDTFLVREGANTLAMRNGANPQALYLYNTYTDASNYERASMSLSEGFFAIRTQASGTGGARTIAILPNSGIWLGSSSVVRWVVATDGHFAPQEDNMYDLGGVFRHVRDLYLAGINEFVELGTDPFAGAANTARLFAKDNGSGKTQLCVRFPTGAVQVLSTEP